MDNGNGKKGGQEREEGRVEGRRIKYSEGDGGGRIKMTTRHLTCSVSICPTHLI